MMSGLLSINCINKEILKLIAKEEFPRMDLNNMFEQQLAIERLRSAIKEVQGFRYQSPGPIFIRIRKPSKS